MVKKTSVKSNLAFISIVSILISSSIVLLITYFQLSNLVDISIEDHMRDIMDTFQIEIDWELDCAENMAVRIAESENLIEAMKAGEKENIKNTLEKFHETAAMDTDNVAVTDAQGNVIYCLYHHDITQSLASNECVAAALQGRVSTSVSEGPTVRMGAVSAAPVKNESGNIIGTVMVAYDFENHTLVDDVKGDADSEYTIFNGDERLSTTLQSNGERLVGTKMSENIAETVLRQGNEYTGEAIILGNSYTSYYRPIKSESGTVIGAMFCGVLTSNVKAAQQNALISSIIASLAVTAAVAAIVILYVNKRIAQPIKSLCHDTEEMARGNLQVEVAKGPESEIGDLAGSVKLTVESLRGYIEDISVNLEAIANGDMNISITKDYVGDFASIKASLEKISGSLNNTLSSISQAAQQVSSGSEQVSQGAQSLSQGTIEQASSIEKLSASIQAISSQVSQNSDYAGEADTKTDEVKKEMGEANDMMNELVRAMADIRESSGQTQKIIKSIEDIAFQTNILALNAAVEAARAGDAGKGFAVVADEVRNLAAKSAEAAGNTTALIENTVDAINKGDKLVTRVAEKMTSNLNHTKYIAGLCVKIAESSKEAADSVSQISSGIMQISDVVQTNSATAEQSAAASQELSGQAVMLQREISQFKLRN